MSEVPRKPNVKQLSLESVMTFGEFKGQTVKEVADERPSYLVWAIKNVEWFEIDAAARKYGQRRLNEAERRRIDRMDAWAWGFPYDDDMQDHEMQG